MSKQSQSLIFKNLPVELEELILFYHKKINDDLKLALYKYEDGDLIEEIRRRNLQYPAMNYKYRNIWCHQYNVASNERVQTLDTIIFPLTERQHNANEIVNKLLMDNLHNGDIIIGINYIDKPKLMELVEGCIKRIEHNYTNNDPIDNKILIFWYKLLPNQKRDVIELLMVKVKAEYLLKMRLIDTRFDPITTPTVVYTCLRQLYLRKFNLK